MQPRWCQRWNQYRWQMRDRLQTKAWAQASSIRLAVAVRAVHVEIAAGDDRAAAAGHAHGHGTVENRGSGDRRALALIFGAVGTDAVEAH